MKSAFPLAAMSVEFRMLRARVATQHRILAKLEEAVRREQEAAEDAYNEIWSRCQSPEDDFSVFAHYVEDFRERLSRADGILLNDMRQRSFLAALSLWEETVTQVCRVIAGGDGALAAALGAQPALRDCQSYLANQMGRQPAAMRHLLRRHWDALFQAYDLGIVIRGVPYPYQPDARQMAQYFDETPGLSFENGSIFIDAEYCHGLLDQIDSFFGHLDIQLRTGLGLAARGA